MKNRKSIATLSAAVLLVTGLSGCSDNSEGQSGNPNVVISAALVNDAKAETFKEQLNQSLPDMGIEISTISVGDTSKDPAMAAAGIMRLTTLVAGQEADVLIADHDSAQRNAKSELFYPLTELFTEEELEPYQDRIISFELTDEEGNPTGETVENCGIDVSSQSELAELCPGADSVGIYIVSNSPNLDAAKEIFRNLVFLEN